MELMILGAGGTVELLQRYSLAELKVCGSIFWDDNSTDELVIGKCSDYINHISQDTELYPAFGNNEGRLQWIERLEAAKAVIPTIIYNTAYVSPKATVGKGTVVLPKAIINTSVRIERGCIINCGAIIDHGCVIDDGVHICLGAIIKAENRIPRCMKVETGMVIENRTYLVG